MARDLLKWFGTTLPLGAVLLGAGGCQFGEEPSADGEKAVVAVEAALTEPVTVITRTDDSASPIHIQIKECTTTAAADAHVAVDCVVDPEFALVGGGAAGIGSSYGGSPFLTESRPYEERTWRASSTKHLVSASHKLAVYAIGMRLDGVNTQVLRDSIQWKQVQLTGDTASAHHQRSDVCAVPAAGVVAEAMVAIVLAEAVLEKFGGDHVAETRRNLEGYLAAIPETLRTAPESDAELAAHDDAR